MKHLSKLILTTALLLICSSTFAQKFGYINSSELITSMPEYKEAMQKLKEYEAELSAQLESIMVELNTKYADYQKNVSTYTDVIRQAKESELTSINDRLEQNREKMGQDYQLMSSQLIDPIKTKAQGVVNEVGKANGFTLIFDVTVGAMVYHDENTVVNILPLVKAKMGIKE